MDNIQKTEVGCRMANTLDIAEGTKNIDNLVVARIVIEEASE